jgi:hypothetical protein
VPGHGALPVLPPGPARTTSPFGPAIPSIVAALVYAAAVGVWLVAGDALPAGRPFAVHLFTLGVLTNLVLTFSEHFARTLTRTPGERAWWWPLVTNAGIVAVLAGLLTRWLPLVVGGATTLVVVVTLAYGRLRAMRRRAVGARFGWIVRLYEWAHLAFLSGAVLGALLGAGVVGGTWFGAVRLAHLHANLLGWGGLTLLATLVFFGPTMARTRIEPGADAVAARALGHAAAALAVVVVLLLVAGVGGTVGSLLSVLGGFGIGVVALAVTRVCLPTVRAVRRGPPSAPRPLVASVCVWFVAILWADALVVGTRSWRWLDALGVAALTGVLAQAILATLLYLAPLLRGRTAPAREVIRDRLDRGARLRALAVSMAVVLLAVGASRIADAAPLAAVGWSLFGGVVVTSAVTVLWPLPHSRPLG